MYGARRFRGGGFAAALIACGAALSVLGPLATREITSASASTPSSSEPSESADAQPPSVPLSAPRAAVPPAAPKNAHPGRLAAASENEISARAAIEVMRQGGNAVDGAIAAALTLGVTAPSSCGIGGGGFALVYDATSRTTTALDFREVAPAIYDERVFSSGVAGAKIGVPGEVYGLWELHRRFGRLALTDDAMPAIQAAEEGFVVTPHLAGALVDHADVVRAPSALAPIYAPAGKIATMGTKVVNRPLANTLRQIASTGVSGFYEGPLAKAIVSAAHDAGSPMTLADLAAYRPVDRHPLHARWGGFDVFTFPPPSAGGIMVLEILGLYSSQELRSFGLGTPSYDHMLAEGLRGAFADRMHLVGDPAFTPDASDVLLAPERLRARRASLSGERTHAAVRFELKEAGTAHLVVTDAKGSIVSLTTTINNSFGSHVAVADAGIVLNDELDDFTATASAKRFGVSPKTAPNAPRGGARPTSSMTPTLVFRGEEPKAALGGSGGWRIGPNVTQVLLASLGFGKNAHEALGVRRFFTPTSGPILSYPPKQLPSPSVLVDLEERGEQVQQLSSDETAVQIITWTESASGDARIDAAGDPRKGGAAIVE